MSDTDKIIDEHIKSERHLVQSIAAVVTKIALFVCIAVVIGMTVSKCQLSAETMVACEEACARDGSQMKSVTSRECICTESASNNDDIWVIPRQSSTHSQRSETVLDAPALTISNKSDSSE